MPPTPPFPPSPPPNPPSPPPPAPPPPPPPPLLSTSPPPPPFLTSLPADYATAFHYAFQKTSSKVTSFIAPLPAACGSALLDDFNAQITAGSAASPVVLSAGTCRACQSAGFCVIGFNNVTGVLTGWATPSSLRCSSTLGGLRRADSSGRQIQFCQETRLGPTIILSVSLSLLGFFLCWPCGACMYRCQKRRRERRAGISVAEHEASKAHHQEEITVGCCACTIEDEFKGARLRELPSYDVERMSDKQRTHVMAELEQMSHVSFTDPRLDFPSNDGGALGAPRWLFCLAVALLRAAGEGGAYLWRGVMADDEEGRPPFRLRDRRVASFLLDWKFFLFNNHPVLGVFYVHPLAPPSMHWQVKGVSLFIELVFAYAINALFCRLPFNQDASSCQASQGCDPQLYSRLTAYGHDLPTAKTTAAATLALSIISALVNTPFKFLGGSVCMRCTLLCCHERSRFKTAMRTLGLWVWLVCGLPLAVALFIYAVQGSSNPGATAKAWIISTVIHQCVLSVLILFVSFAQAYRLDVGPPPAKYLGLFESKEQKAARLASALGGGAADDPTSPPAAVEMAMPPDAPLGERLVSGLGPLPPSNLMQQPDWRKYRRNSKGWQKHGLSNELQHLDYDSADEAAESGGGGALLRWSLPFVRLARDVASLDAFLFGSGGGAEGDDPSAETQARLSELGLDTNPEMLFGANTDARLLPALRLLYEGGGGGETSAEEVERRALRTAAGMCAVALSQWKETLSEDVVRLRSGACGEEEARVLTSRIAKKKTLQAALIGFRESAAAVQDFDASQSESIC